MKKTIRGRELARAMIARVGLEAAALSEQLGRSATLAIVAASDESGQRFIQVKRDALSNVDIRIEPAWLDDAASTEDALAHVHAFNTRDDVDAIFIQFPLPSQIDAVAVANAIAIAKDVDCSSERAFEQFTTGSSPFTPVAPHAALDLLGDQLGSLEGRRVAIAGEDEFARALALLLVRRGAVVGAASEESDALVVVDRWPRFFAPVVLDAGYYLPPREAGWIPDTRADEIAVYLPQYGNVGPLTIAHLFEATVQAALKHSHERRSAESHQNDRNTRS